MADLGIRGGYEALARGDDEPLRALLAPDCEWVEPDGSVRRGAAETLRALSEIEALEAAEVLELDDRAIVTGLMRAAGQTMPFAHHWELRDGVAVRGSAYFDRGRVTVAAARRQLAEVADDLLEQAGEIRRQWARLGDALRAAGLEDQREGAAAAAAGASALGSASARLVAVDMAHEGGTREEVEVFLREELGVQDADAILDEVFPPAAGGEPAAEPGVAGRMADAARLTRLFARNRG